VRLLVQSIAPRRRLLSRLHLELRDLRRRRLERIVMEMGEREEGDIGLDEREQAGPEC
jgi:hypothetical protein